MPTKYTQPASQNKNAAASPNLPVKTFRLGRIKAAVWENEADQKFYSVTFARSYRDEANNYHDTDSFGRDDLPLVANAGHISRFGYEVDLRDFTERSLRRRPISIDSAASGFAVPASHMLSIVPEVPTRDAI